MQARDAGTIELGRRLEAYARARLSPDPRATARTRARVLREARLSYEASRIAVHVGPAIAASRQSTRRRMLMPILAAAVWLGIAVGTNAAAQPGGLLYPTRMWVETALLPSDPVARTEAELDRLDARLAEALNGAAHGDRAAVGAALDAYYVIADDVLADSANDPGLEDRVADALDHHVALLTAIADRLADKENLTASDAIERNIQRAIDHNAAVIQSITTPGKPQPDGATGGGGAGGSGTGASGTGASGTDASGTGGAGTGGAGTGGAGGGATSGGGTGASGAGAGPTGGATGGANGGGSSQKSPKPTPTVQPDHTPRAPGR